MTSSAYPRGVDVAIVGSGPAGATYARVLSELAPEATIALFEAGPVITDPPGAHVKTIADSAERSRAQHRSQGLALGDYADDQERLVRPGTFLLETGWRQPGEDGMPAAAMSSNVGGMAAHWTGACPRPGDSERIEFVPNIDELLTEAERLLGVSADVLAGAPLADLVRSRLSATFDHGRDEQRRVQPMPLAVRRVGEDALIWSGSDVVFGETTRSNPRFRLFPDSPVTRILVRDGAARGVVVAGEHSVEASAVVVAADSLRTPQLLHASGVRPPALGRYLNDQPQIVLATHLHDAQPDGGTPGQSGVSWVPFTDDQPFHGQVMQLDASPVPIDDTPAPGSIVGLGWFCAKDVRETDRVAFSDDAVDHHGLPALRIHYALTDRDRANLRRARESILEAAHALGKPLDSQPLVFPPGASLHYQGTVRMGPAEDGTSVCDTASRVWGVDGLHVAGNGVIPTATACNPTLTSVALAVAGARELAAGLRPATTE